MLHNTKNDSIFDKHLNLSLNKIDHNKINVIMQNTGLITLDLSYNDLSNLGKYIAQILINNPTLEKLNLEMSRLTDEDIYHICKALIREQHLKKLNLSYNSLSDKAIYLISRALQNNKYLRELDISHNNFGDNAAEFIANLIRNNICIEILNMSSNHVSDTCGIIIERAIECNTALMEFNINGNKLSKETIDLIENHLDRNCESSNIEEADIHNSEDSGNLRASIFKHIKGIVPPTTIVQDLDAKFSTSFNGTYMQHEIKPVFHPDTGKLYQINIFTDKTVAHTSFNKRV